MKENLSLTAKRALLFLHLASKEWEFGVKYKLLKGNRAGTVGIVTSSTEHGLTSNDFANVDGETLDRSSWYEFIGKPIMIGDVLEEMFFEKDGIELMKKWGAIKENVTDKMFSKSLNEILNSEIWDHYETLDDDRTVVGMKGEYKNKNIQFLWTFLWGRFEGEILKTNKQ